MAKLSPQACLGALTRQQAPALFFPRLVTASCTPGPELSHTASQTRRLHHQICNTRPQTHPSRQASRPSTLPPNSNQLPPLPSTPYTRHPYTTTTTPQPPSPTIHSLFDPQTSTWQYLVADPSTHTAAIIDPVLDYTPTTRTVSTTTADALLSLIHSGGYTISHILETHAHADHLTAAFYLQRRLAAVQKVKPPVGIGRRIGQVQSVFGRRYGIDSEEYDGVFDLLWKDDEVFAVGGLSGEVMHLPGHTPDHVGYRIGDNVFCGDSLFHPTLGTARCDFPGGSAQALYQSARKLLALPDHVKIWTGHDYPVEGGPAAEPWTSVGEHRARNKHIRDGVSESEFVQMRRERDRHLAAPRLLHESLQVNIRAGQLPKVDESGMRTFKLPVKVQGEGW
ncbi:putative beta-lactamase hydrolase-like protein [Parachaetomium inaequale]|uniref:Beta-lactamase hydrolase-like protein n=1 Tax=Parachaetomium inaequale TaxID=2588326 RepID=A0AAN6PHZ2_9PEZI|nr:putative beta-lactamase hydrolase-like protein [Parachaetomium inaequale]